MTPLFPFLYIITIGDHRGYILLAPAAKNTTINQKMQFPPYTLIIVCIANSKTSKWMLIVEMEQ
jgi:hypothetical protein